MAALVPWRKLRVYNNKLSQQQVFPPEEAPCGGEYLISDVLTSDRVRMMQYGDYGRGPRPVRTCFELPGRMLEEQRGKLQQHGNPEETRMGRMRI